MKLCKKQKILASRLQRPVAARNDVIAKKIASGLFQNRSGRPEDWTVSGPCHLYYWRLSTWKLVLTKKVSKNWIHAACLSSLTIGKIILLQHFNFFNFTLSMPTLFWMPGPSPPSSRQWVWWANFRKLESRMGKPGYVYRVRNWKISKTYYEDTTFLQ